MHTPTGLPRQLARKGGGIFRHAGLSACQAARRQASVKPPMGEGERGHVTRLAPVPRDTSHQADQR